MTATATVPLALPDDGNLATWAVLDDQGQPTRPKSGDVPVGATIMRATAGVFDTDWRGSVAKPHPTSGRSVV